MGSRKEVNDPRGYVHIIPWSELETVEPGQLIAEGIDIEIPFQKNIIEVQWVLWSPPFQGIPWSHPLFTEEQVFGYNILNTWYFPDHILRGKTIFAVHKLGSTDFVTNLFEYWENWVQFAISSTMLKEDANLCRTTVPLHKNVRDLHFCCWKQSQVFDLEVD